MKPQTIFAVCVMSLCSVCAGQALACDDGMVRDAAFDQPRDVYRLCIFARSDDTEAAEGAERLKAWQSNAAGELNLEVVFVDVDSPDVVWTDYGIPSAPPELPVVALVGSRSSDRKSFVVDHWAPGPTPSDLEALRSSPARDAIRVAVVKNLALLIHIPSANDTSHKDSAEENVATVVDRVCQLRNANRPKSVSILHIDRNDENERLLLAFTNIRSDGPDWVGVIFGQGKFMTPLEGKEITEAGLIDMLDALEADCTCSQSPSRLGVDILMEWNEEADDQVVRLARPAGPASSAATDAQGDSADNQIDGLASENAPRFLATVLWSLGGLALISIGTTVGILWRRQNQNI